MGNIKDRVWEVFRGVRCPSRVSGSYSLRERDIFQLMAADQRSLDENVILGYLSEVMLTHGGPGDLRYLLPGILDVWERQGSRIEYFNEVLAGALSRKRFLYEELEPRQRTAVLEFIRSVILERLAAMPVDIENAATEWELAIGLLHGYATYAEDLRELWARWWSMQCDGHRVAIIAYLASLAFDDDDNPMHVMSTTLLRVGNSDNLPWLMHNLAVPQEFFTLASAVSACERVCDQSESDMLRSAAFSTSTTIRSSGWRF